MYSTVKSTVATQLGLLGVSTYDQVLAFVQLGRREGNMKTVLDAVSTAISNNVHGFRKRVRHYAWKLYHEGSL